MRVHLMFWFFLMLVIGLVQFVPRYAIIALLISFYKRDKISCEVDSLYYSLEMYVKRTRDHQREKGDLIFHQTYFWMSRSACFTCGLMEHKLLSFLCFSAE